MFSGAVQRKFPSDKFPDARLKAKNAANKAGLIAPQRVHGTGKYDASEKMKKNENVETPQSKNKKD